MIPIRDENPTETFPVVTIGLIVVNALVFIWELGFGIQKAAFIYGSIPLELFYNVELTPHHPMPPYLNLFTSMFLHGGFLHIVGNMLYLWIFGNNVEDVLGHVRFLIFYLLCGLIAGYVHAFFHQTSRIPMIGASGAISGVLGAYLVRFPFARIETLVFFFFYVFVVPIPAFFYIIFWFLLQVMNGLLSYGLGGAGGVAWFAHIGGFLAGIVLYFLFPKRT